MNSDGMGRALFGVHGDALALRSERLQVIASNIANADTPGYKARDIDFDVALRAVVARDKNGGNGGQGGPPAAVGIPREVYRVPAQPSLDGNTVDTDMEHAAFARAALEYRASLGFVEDRARSIVTALTGQ
ncbi:MAG: flagellar basal body rod protein FlgB [Pseudomonadota bacterium]